MNEVNGKIVTQDCSLSGLFWIGDLPSSCHSACNNPYLCSNFIPPFTTVLWKKTHISILRTTRITTTPTPSR